MNYTTTNLAMTVVVILAVALIVIIPGYLQDAKAATKTHSKSLSMSTSCNGPDEPCQTTVCEDNKPCRNLDSNSSQPQQTENTTAAAQSQQPDSSSDDDEMTPFLQTPSIPQIPNYSDYGFD